MYTITRRIGSFIIRLTLLALVALTALSALPAPKAAQAAPAAMAVRNLFVDPVRGNDANGGWSPDKPLKTLAKALAKVKPGCTIHLAKGRYTKNVNGEQYPVLVPAGVTIVGTLETNGAKGSFLSASSSAAGETGLTFVGDATVKDLELDVFGTAITANKGKLTLSNLNFILNRVNVDLKGTAQATLNNAYVFVGNGQTAVSVGEQARLTMDAGVLENVAGCAGGDGIFAAENAILQVKNTRFSGFGARTIGMVGQATGSISNSEFTNAASCDGSRVLFLNEQAHLKLDTVNSTATKGLPSEFVELGGHTILEANRLTISNYTLAVDAQGAASIITLTNSTFQNNTTAFLGGNGGQLNVSKSSFLNNNTGLRGFYIKLRNSSVLGGEVGIDAISEKVDLGTVNDPGNNIFRSSSDTSVQFFSHSSSVELFAIGNIWNGNTQGALSDGKYPLSIDRIGINNLLANGQNFKLVPPSATPFVYAIRLNP